MAKKAKDAKQVVGASTKARIVGAFNSVMQNVHDSVGFVATIAKSIAPDYKDAVPNSAMKEITEALAESNPQWKPRTKDSRLSEARAIMRSHHVLEPYCTAVRDSKKNVSGNFTWHNAVRVARIWVRLNGNAKGKTVSTKAVVAEYFKSNGAEVTPSGRVVDAVLKLNPSSNLYQELIQVLDAHKLISWETE